MGVLSGKVVLVTGGGNGIGRECALQAAKEGAKVLVNDLGGGIKGDDEGSAGPAEEVAREIRAAGGQAASNSESITSLAAVQGMVEQALRELGGLHAIMNPAGIIRDVMLHKMGEADWDKVLEVHLKGAFNVTRASIEHFRDQNEGSYVFFTSTSGLFGSVGQANYGAAKMGVAGLSRIVAMEGARSNVRANCVSPIAWTRMVASIPVRDDAMAAQLKAMSETIRADQPARLAVALASPQSTATGQIFGCSGETLGIFSQPRLKEVLTADKGWTVETILSEALPTLSRHAHLVERSPSIGVIGLSDD